MSEPSLSLNGGGQESAVAAQTGEPGPIAAEMAQSQANVQLSGASEVAAGNGRGLPLQVAYLPVSNPAQTTAPAAKEAVENAVSAEKPEKPGESPATNPANAKNSGSSEPKSEFYVTATDPNTLPTAEPRKSWLRSYFGSTPSRTVAHKPQPVARPVEARSVEARSVEAARPVEARSPRPVVKASFGAGENFLPGVRQEGLFEIKRRSGVDDDSDIDLHEEEEGRSYRVASAAGLARLAPNGLLTQTDQVDVSCLKPDLIRILKTVERRYGKKVLVTSGYRNPTHNRRVRGARNSQHMYCAATDIQVPGVSKWELAAFVRALPGRGGVGTYCHTASIHVDVGPERDWNWRCRKGS